VTRRTALLAGATGLVGGECLRQLLACDDYTSVTVVARRPLGAAAKHRKVREIVVDFAQLDSVAAELRADHVYCALGSTIRKAGSREAFRRADFEYPRRLAQLARANGAGYFALVSALGASTASPFFYSRVKGELEESLQAMDWPGLCFVRPSVIAGDRTESRPVEQLSGRLLSWGPAVWRPVPATAIAAAMIATALQAPPGVTTIESADIRTAAA
jgi:uncharacterized protein YbjT (DUF2867 family)